MNDVINIKRYLYDLLLLLAQPIHGTALTLGSCL